jgi:sulfide dehydrogenase [flavocytochrome c] flavoprotein chain
MLRRTFLNVLAGGAVLAQQSKGRPARADAPELSNEKIVVLGGGFAGAQTASNIKRIMPQVDVTLVEKHDRFVVGPLVFDYLFGRSEFDQITVEYEGLRRRGIRVVTTEVLDVDPARRSVQTADGILPYTRLILAGGTRLTHEAIEEWPGKAAGNLCIYDRKSLAELRKRIAELDNETIIVGIPDSRIVCPPAPYEFVLLLAECIRRKQLAAKIVVLDAGVGPQPQPLSDRFSREISQFKGIIEYVDSIGAIQTVDPAQKLVRTKFGDEFEYSWLSVVPQGTASSFVRNLDLAEVPGGSFAAVDPLSMRTAKHHDIFAVGDMAQTPYGKSAFAAVTCADICARQLAADLEIAQVDQSRIVNVACYPHIDAQTALSMKVRYEFAPDSSSDHLQSSVRVGDADRANLEERRQWLDTAIAGAFGRPTGPLVDSQVIRRE